MSKGIGEDEQVHGNSLLANGSLECLGFKDPESLTWKERGGVSNFVLENVIHAVLPALTVACILNLMAAMGFIQSAWVGHAEKIQSRNFSGTILYSETSD